jgi:hypothetical protein
MREMFDEISNQSSIMKATVHERRSGGKSPASGLSTDKRSKYSRQGGFEAE